MNVVDRGGGWMGERGREEGRGERGCYHQLTHLAVSLVAVSRNCCGLFRSKHVYNICTLTVRPNVLPAEIGLLHHFACVQKFVALRGQFLKLFVIIEDEFVIHTRTDQNSALITSHCTSQE